MISNQDTIIPEPTINHNTPSTFTYLRYKKYSDLYGSRDENYKNFLKGKRVVVIGPSPNLLGKNLGDYINSFDIVVRLNQSYPTEISHKEDLGNRTDILCHCLNENPRCGNTVQYELMEKEGVFLSSPYPQGVMPFHKDVIKFMNRNQNRIPYHLIDKEFYLFLVSTVKTRINSGTSCILDLLAFPLKELYVFGFTWYIDGWRDSYKTNGIIERELNNNPIHYQQPQKEMIKELALNDSRLYIDDVMKKILEI